MPVTEDFGVVGERHVKVFAGRGTHNNFAIPGQHPSPREKSIFISACDVNGTDQHSDAPVDDKYRKRRLALLGLLKILLGILLGVPLLPEVGAAAFGLEAMPRDTPESGFGPDTEDAPRPRRRRWSLRPRIRSATWRCRPRRRGRSPTPTSSTDRFGGRRRSGRPKAIAAHGA